MKTKLIALSLALLASGALFGEPQEKQTKPDLSFTHGTWLCGDFFAAYHFDHDVKDTEKLGITLSGAMIDQIAKNQNHGYRCWYVQSDSLAVVKFNGLFGDLAVRLSDGKNSGWTAEGMFLSYMKFHKVVAR